MKCSVKRCQLFSLRGENPTGGAFVLQWTVKLQPFVIQRTSLSNAAEVAVEVRRLLSIRLHFPSESSARFFAGHDAADAGSRKRAKAPAESRSARCRQAARFLSEALHLDARYLLRDHSARRRRAVPLVFTSSDCCSSAASPAARSSRCVDACREKEFQSQRTKEPEASWRLCI